MGAVPARVLEHGGDYGARASDRARLRPVPVPPRIDRLVPAGPPRPQHRLFAGPCCRNVGRAPDRVWPHGGGLRLFRRRRSGDAVLRVAKGSPELFADPVYLLGVSSPGGGAGCWRRRPDRDTRWRYGDLSGAEGSSLGRVGRELCRVPHRRSITHSSRNPRRLGRPSYGTRVCADSQVAHRQSGADWCDPAETLRRPRG